MSRRSVFYMNCYSTQGQLRCGLFVYKGKSGQILKASPGIFVSIKTKHFEINCHLTVCYYKNPILHVKA